jgi:ABC-2 type transport system permease protein
MRNIGLILRREYLERVRTKSFLISTILLPLFMFGMIFLPSKLAMMKTAGTKHIAVVSDNAEIAKSVASQLQDGTRFGAKYSVDLINDTSDDERAKLRTEVSSGQLDGFIWLSNDAIASRDVTYGARETSDFTEDAGLQSAITSAIMKHELASRGVPASDVDSLLKEVRIKTVPIQQGKESGSVSGMEWLSSFLLAMMLYLTLIVYGMSVMRSVLEEKTSRVMEVMLSCVTPKQLMAGKILGVGAAGLTQIAIWCAIAGVFGGAGAVASGNASQLGISAGTLAALVPFFLAGFLLYSGLYAALGAMVNSEQEAQQWQFFVTMPLVVPVILLTYVIRQPNAPLSMWMSMVPFFAPILMYVRVLVERPPMWQIGLCVALLLITMYGVLALCSRIYRVGILMYGKRPTLPEIVKWLRYS